MTNKPLPTAAHRYAVYFAPHPETPAWLAGSHWLGRCAALQQTMQQPAMEGVEPQSLARLTAAPRRYGWHATLKAPFRLAPGVDWQALQHGVHSLARTLRPFQMPPMQVQPIDDFLALVPVAAHPANVTLQAAAAACVTQLQPLAAPLSASELARRRTAQLTPQQDALLQQWGYPFVLEAFRFHLSLTGSLAGAAPDTVASVMAAAQQFFADLPPLQFNSLALFAEPTPGADCVLLNHIKVGA